MVPSIQAPAVLDTDAAQILRASLLEALENGDGVTVDMSQVERIGTAGLQVLVSATQTFAKHDAPFSLSRPSRAVCAACAEAGLTFSNDLQAFSSDLQESSQ